jgi:hypothetical protein
VSLLFLIHDQPNGPFQGHPHLFTEKSQLLFANYYIDGVSPPSKKAGYYIYGVLPPSKYLPIILMVFHRRPKKLGIIFMAFYRRPNICLLY